MSGRAGPPLRHKVPHQLRALDQVPGRQEVVAHQVEALVRRSGGFDVIHSHVDYLPWLAQHRLQAPLVTTLHGRLDLPELRPLFTMHPE